jgi:hypothetical protein
MFRRNVLLPALGSNSMPNELRVRTKLSSFHGFSQSFQANANVVGLPWLGHYRFLPNPFQFIIYQSSYCPTLYSLDTCVREWLTAPPPTHIISVHYAIWKQGPIYTVSRSSLGCVETTFSLPQITSSSFWTLIYEWYSSYYRFAAHRTSALGLTVEANNQSANQSINQSVHPSVSHSTHSNFPLCVYILCLVCFPPLGVCCLLCLIEAAGMSKGD